MQVRLEREFKHAIQVIAEKIQITFVKEKYLSYLQ